MRLLLDAMGGDYAPLSTVEGAILALNELPADVHLDLVGDVDILTEALTSKGAADRFHIYPSKGIIEMGEHPAKAFSQKPTSSIAVGFGLLKAGKVQGLCSAGNTGAMLVGSMFSVKAIEGIIRPGIATFIPNEKTGKYTLLLDAGANADCKPDVLAQFAVIGSVYAQHLFSIDQPKVGLMNLGEEEQKGTPTTQATHQLLKINDKINFIGNIEGRDCFNGKSDVIVCDGFTGNVILKMAESFFDITKARGIKDPFFDLFDYEKVGGSPILGINGNVMIGHGSSSPEAIKNMVLMTYRQVKNDIHTKIKEAIG